MRQIVHQEIFVKAPSGNLVRLKLEFVPEISGQVRVFAPQSRNDRGQVEAIETLEELKACLEKAEIPHYCYEGKTASGKKGIDSITLGQKK